MDTSEKFYDYEIAPRLMKICELCEEKGMPFLAAVEYVPGLFGLTQLIIKGECIEMVMIRHCAKTAPNIDGYIIGLSRWAKENDIDTSGSIIMNLLQAESPQPKTETPDAP